MAWVAVNRYGDEYIYEAMPERLNCVWAPTFCEYENRVVRLRRTSKRQH